MKRKTSSKKGSKNREVGSNQKSVQVVSIRSLAEAQEDDFILADTQELKDTAQDRDTTINQSK